MALIVWHNDEMVATFPKMAQNSQLRGRALLGRVSPVEKAYKRDPKKARRFVGKAVVFMGEHM